MTNQIILPVLFFFLLIHFIGCSESTSNQNISSQFIESKDANKEGFNPNIDLFVKQFKQAKPGASIPPEFSNIYIKPALINEKLHPYLETNATYSYGPIAYEDSTIVALTYYYKAVHKKNLLAASFIATFQRPSGQFIDNKMIFGSSTFNLIKANGYNMGLNYKSEMIYPDNDSIIFELNSLDKRIYNYPNSAVRQKQNEEVIRIFQLHKNGHYIELNTAKNNL